MQIKHSLLTLYSCLLVVIPTAMILAVGVLTRDVAVSYTHRNGVTEVVYAE